MLPIFPVEVRTVGLLNHRKRRESRGVVSLDLLVLNSGEWLLAEELAASPWHVLIYRQIGEPRNELHLWLPRQDAPRSEKYASRRYWVYASERWCVEIPGDPGSDGADPAARRLRFTNPGGAVLWASHTGALGLADLSDRELGHLLAGARPGSFSGV